MANKARGMVCWRDFDGTRKRICDTDNGPPDFQCPNAATIVLVCNDGDVEHACSQGCLDILRTDDEGEFRPIRLMGKVPSGFSVYCYQGGGP